MRKLNIFFKLTVWILSGTIGFRILYLALALFTVVTVQESLSGTGNNNSLEFVDTIGRIEDIAGNVITIGVGICFLGWFFLSYKKAQRHSNQSFSYKPILALFSFIIPILNLFAPYKIMHEIWAAENRNPSQEEKGRKLINMWWVLSLIIFVYSRYCNYQFRHIAELNQLVTAEYYNMIYYTVCIHYLLTLIKVMKLINDEQNYPKEPLP